VDNPNPDHDSPELVPSAHDSVSEHDVTTGVPVDDAELPTKGTNVTVTEETVTGEPVTGTGASVAASAAVVPSADSGIPADEWMVDGVPVYPDGAPRSWAPGLMVGFGLLVAALASVFFVYDAEPTPDSTLVARVSAEPTPEPTSAPTAEPTAAPTAAPRPTAVPVAAPILIPQLAAESGQFQILTGLLGQYGLDALLNSDGPFTVFAPTDAAFDTINPQGLTEDQIGAIISHHVVAGEIRSDELAAGTVLTSLIGEPIEIGSDFAIVDTNASVVAPDLAADNGLIHVIDGMIIPGSLLQPGTVDALIQDRRNTTLAASFFDDIGLREDLRGEGPLTVFVPSDGALGSADLSSLREGEDVAVGRYHVVAGLHPSTELVSGETLVTLQGEALTIGRGLTVNGAQPLEVNLAADNGLVHIYDSVLIPPSIATRNELNSLFALEPVQFAVSSAVILPESEATLDQAVQVLLANDIGAITIEGHTDGDGAADANLTLSQARAESVLAYLVDGGVDADRLTAEGFGETRLKVDPEITPEEKAQNRRIEFALN